jgi:conjugal transfer pilus assembly protein TraV
MLKISSVCIFIFLSGCAAYGNKQYGCSGLPEGVRCTSTSDLYEATHSGQIPTRTDVASINTNDRDHSISASLSKNPKGTSPDNKIVADPVIDTFVTPNLPDRPVPIRTPAKVMRIWVSTWEDAETGALIAPGYIYTEIEPRRWVIGKPESAASQQNRLFKPLEQSSTSSNQKPKE